MDGNMTAVVLAQATEALPQVHLAAQEFFGGGVYLRAITIPAGTLLVGDVHLTENMNLVLSGRIRMLNEEGTELTAGAVVVGKAGEAKAAVALEDTVWVTIHATTLTDSEEIRRTFTRPIGELYGLGSNRSSSNQLGEHRPGAPGDEEGEQASPEGPAG